MISIQNIPSKIYTIRNIAVAGIVIVCVALLFNASGTLNAQVSPVVNNGDVISLVGSHDIYVAVVDGDTRYKRHFTNPEVFEAYGRKSWDDVLSVSSTVFDSFETRAPFTSVSAVRTFVATTTPPTATPTTPTTPSGTIQNGDAIRAQGSDDVYLVKFTNNKYFKRLILNPDVFNSYEHLLWDSVKSVSPPTINQYTTSNLVQYEGNVYALFPAGDTGTRRFVNVGSTYDQDSVYEINSVELRLYDVGFPITLPETTPTTPPSGETMPPTVTLPIPPAPEPTPGRSGGGGAIISNPTRLKTPENLTAEIPDHATITDPIVIKDPSNAEVSWQKVDNATGYEIQWCTSSCPENRDWSSKATVNGGATTTYRITAGDNRDGIFADRASAKIRVRALKGTSSGRRSRWATTTVNSLVSLEPVTNLRVLGTTALGRNQYRIAWDRPATPSDTANIEYDVMYYKAGTDWYTAISRNPDESLGEDTTKRSWNAYYFRGAGGTPCALGATRPSAENNNRITQVNITVCHSVPEAYLSALGQWNVVYLVWVRQRQNDSSAFSAFSKPLKIVTSRFDITHTSTADSITLEWNKTLDSVNGNRVLNKKPDRNKKYVDTYEVEYCLASTGCDQASEWDDSTASIRTKSGDQTKATTTISSGLTRSTDYKVRIKPTFTDPNDETAEIFTFWTTYDARTADSVTLPALGNLRVKDTGGGRNLVLVGWDAPGIAPDAFEVQYKAVASNRWVTSDIQTLASRTSADTPTSGNPSCKIHWQLRKGAGWNTDKNAYICPTGNEVLFADLQSWHTVYELEVRQRTGTGISSEYSAWQELKIATTGLRNPTATSNSIVLEWDQIKGATPTGWQVQYCDNSTGCDAENEWNNSTGTTTDHATVQNRKTHTIPGLSPSTTYKLRVKPTFADTDIITNWGTQQIATTS